MKQARESIQNLIVNSEVDDTNSDQELASNTFCQETTFLNSPMASQENTTEEGTLTLSPMSAQRKRSESSLERTPNNREMKTEVDNKSRRSSLRTPVPERLSQVSTGSTLPFAGFEIPEATVIPSDSMANLAPKQKKNLQMKEAIPVMPLPAAIVCLVLNVIIPGSGQLLLTSILKLNMSSTNTRIENFALYMSELMDSDNIIRNNNNMISKAWKKKITRRDEASLHFFWQTLLSPFN